MYIIFNKFKKYEDIHEIVISQQKEINMKEGLILQNLTKLKMWEDLKFNLITLSFGETRYFLPLEKIHFLNILND